DFNNVLQIISSNLNLLKRLPGVAEIGGPRIESALRAVSQGGKLATHLLAFARRQPLENELVDLAALLRSVDDMVGTLLRPRTEVSTHIEAGLWSTVIDSGQLTNVLLNLAINARDAMGEGGRLEISARNIAAGAEVLQGSLGDYIGIDIADNGSGMAPEVLRRAFEPFFTTKPVGKGTGLGLSMVYGFISQSGGKMAIASQENVGTRISIFLRKSETDPLVAQAGHSALAVSEQGVETILVVEDDDLVRAAGVEFLSSLGYRVWSAANADEAVALINGGALFDLVFTDVIMPGETDVLALRELVHRKLPACQMLFTSGYAEGKLVHAGKVMPGIMLLHKPYTLEALAARIRHIFGEDGQAALF
ncbi:MAG: ATP-binding protein, partial [Janthinobacterium lividum]